MSFYDLAASRYSVRSFSDKPVPEELLTRVLEAGRLAPTAMNRQPQRIYVIQSPEAMEKLFSVRTCYGAPVVLMICGDTEAACNRPKVDHCLAEMDASIVASHMMLEATELGLGTCWMCAFEPQKLAEAFELPANIVPYLLMPVGYAADDCEPSPRHTQRVPLEETVKYL